MFIKEFLAAAGSVLPNVNFGTPNWGIWQADPAGVITAEDEITQCLITICSTAVGSDPLRPEFGNDYMPYIDLPLPVAAPQLIAKTTAAVATWEPRAKVTAVAVKGTENGRLSIVLTWEPAAVRSAGQPVITTVAL